MIIISRTAPFPTCKYCGHKMDHYIFGIEDSEQCHPECKGRHMAEQVMQDVRKRVFGEVTNGKDQS